MGIKHYKKITIGFVTQEFIDDKCISQEFEAVEAEYDDMDGKPISPDEIENEGYFPYNMVQPAQV